MRTFQIEELLLHMKRIGDEVTTEIEEELRDTTDWIHDLDVALEEELKSGLWSYMYVCMRIYLTNSVLFSIRR